MISNGAESTGLINIKMYLNANIYKCIIYLHTFVQNPLQL